MWNFLGSRKAYKNEKKKGTKQMIAAKSGLVGMKEYAKNALYIR